jgi:hypothetical protein
MGLERRIVWEVYSIGLPVDRVYRIDSLATVIITKIEIYHVVAETFCQR